MRLVLGDIHFIIEFKAEDEYLRVRFPAEDSDEYILDFSKKEAFELFEFLNTVFDKETSSEDIENVIQK